MPKQKKGLWHAKPHTRAKHQILRKYIKSWFAIMGQSHTDSRFLLVDGFCGYGEQKQDDGTILPGSPLIILEELLPQLAKGGRIESKEFDFLFIDADPAAIKHLDAVALPKLGTLPTNINVLTHVGRFDDTLRTILDGIGPDQRLIPAFVMADPFSYKDVPMALLHEVLRHKRSEVLVTFMTDQVNRWLSHPNDAHRRYLEVMLGAQPEDWEHLLQAKGRRADELVKFYEGQLSPRAQYVRSFRMIRKDGHPAYDLVFGTNHIKGLDVMKKAMWAVDPISGGAFFDRTAGNYTIFDDNPDVGPLRTQLRHHFAGRTVLSEDVVEYVITDSAYHSGHVKTLTLKPMEEAKEIEYIETRSGKTRHRPGQYPDGTKIRFLSV